MTDQQQDTNQSSHTSPGVSRASGAGKKWFGSLFDETITPDERKGDRVGDRGSGDEGSSSSIDYQPPSAGQSSAEPPSETGVSVTSGGTRPSIKAEKKAGNSFNLSKTFSPDVIANLLADMAVETHDAAVKRKAEPEIDTDDGSLDGKIGANQTAIATPTRISPSKNKRGASVAKMISRDFVSKMEGLAKETMPSPARQRVDGGSSTREIEPPQEDSETAVGMGNMEFRQLRQDLRAARDELKFMTMQRDALKNERDAVVQSKDSAHDKMAKDLHDLKAEAREATDELKRMTNALELVAKDREEMVTLHEQEMDDMILQQEALAEELRTAEEGTSEASKLNTDLSRRQSYKLCDLEDLEEECQAQEAKAELLKTKNKVLEETLQEQTEALSKIRADLASRDEELKVLRNDMKEMQLETSLDADLDDMRRRYCVLEEENGLLAEELEVATRQVEVSQRELEKAQHIIEDKDKELDELRAASSRCDEGTKQLLARITEMQMEKESLAHDVSELGAQLDESFQLFTVKTAECTTLSERLRRALEEADETGMELEDVQQELVDVQSRYDLLERENKRLRRKIGLAPLNKPKEADGANDDDHYNSDSDSEEEVAGETGGKTSGPLEGLAGLLGRRTTAAAREAPPVSKADLKAQQRAKDEEMIEKMKAELEERNMAAAPVQL
mmetsp:Transcript_11620/g.24487  ORF Transcript_11620/g.24487 Transcript_11620/m.24487 type:complete len:677 (-) Transcript_11620:1295-3325(-)